MSSYRIFKERGQIMMQRKKRLIITIIFSLFIIGIGFGSILHLGSGTDKTHNCRFWGLVFDGELGSDWEKLVRSHLERLKQLSQSNIHGWGIGYYVSPLVDEDEIVPVISRGRPKALLDQKRYDNAVNEMLAYTKNGGIAHVRFASSSYIHIPNPHPFRRISMKREFDMLFAHNGGIDIGILLQLIGDYLSHNPADYISYLDSDLYAIYIMKVIDENPQYTIDHCILLAVNELVFKLHRQGLDAYLNFIMTDGSTIWALRCADKDLDYYTLYYYPANGISDKWIAASEKMNTLNSSIYDWELVPNYSLLVLRPQCTPQIYSWGDSDSKTQMNKAE